MSSYSSYSPFNATVDGGPDDGTPLYEWAEHVFLSQATSRIVAQAVTVTLGIWEFCSFFPAEIVLWRRIARKGRPARSSFAPWTTLALRYLLLCFSVTNAFVSWSTTMPSETACMVSSVFLIASGDLLNAVIAFAIAWRAQAVARGVIQIGRSIRWMQFLVAMLVAAEVFIIIFSVTWPNIRMAYWKAHLHRGSCEPVLQYPYARNATTDSSYAGDPLLWFFIITILFNLVCLIIVMAALRSLAARSRGFSKFINGMRNHSLFFFAITLLCCLLAIIWRSVKNIAWVYQPTTVIEAAVMIRILLAEQDAARRPLDTTFIENTYPAGASRHPSTRGQLPMQLTYPRADTTIQFADHLHTNRDFFEYQQQLQQQQQQQQQQQEQQAGQVQQQFAVPRPIYQPFSVMDNLGQAFSQVDSRNPQDLDEQSLDLSHSGTIDQVPAVYPGVLVEEEQEREGEMQQRQKGMVTQSVKEQHPSTTSDQSNGAAQGDTAAHAKVDAAGEEQGERVDVVQTMARLKRSSSLRSNAGGNYVDDDEDVGTQTVQF